MGGGIVPHTLFLIRLAYRLCAQHTLEKKERFHGPSSPLQSHHAVLKGCQPSAANFATLDMRKSCRKDRAAPRAFVLRATSSYAADGGDRARWSEAPCAYLGSVTFIHIAQRAPAHSCL